MPELPEVETTRRALASVLVGRTIDRVTVRERRLRWPVDAEIESRLAGAVVAAIGRRAKVLVIETDRGTALSHLGMSGTWSVLPGLRASPAGTPVAPPGPHDHVDILCAPSRGARAILLRYHDPRRFGALLWAGSDPDRHPRLAGLGPEPWGGAGPDAIGDHLWRRSRRRTAPLRNLLLDGRLVAGVGNIYASEAAHRAGIHPGRAAGRISRERYRRLAAALSEVLDEAVEAGGTTLRDYRAPDGDAGRFGGRCRVYGRDGAPCPACGDPIRRRVHSARSMYYCPRCQR